MASAPVNRNLDFDNTQSRRADRRNPWLCIAIVGTALVAVWPTAEIGYGDDTAYAHVALVLARTGHLIYNGWETAFLIAQAYWGALFVRSFGFSFLCLRLSTIPFALGSVGFCYLLARRAGLQTRTSLLVTLLFGLSPLFLPVAVSFMTDSPSLFFTFASFYLFLRAARTRKESTGQGWLALAMLTGFLGGTSRQVVWLVPLVVLPYFAWTKRHQKSLWIAALSEWALVIAGVALLTRWFNNQPYSEFQPSLFNEAKLLLHRPFWLVNVTARFALMFLLLILPAAVPLLWRSSIDTWHGPRARQILVGSLLLLVLLAVLIHPSLASIPWISSTLNWQGINGTAPLPGRPPVLTRPIRALVALAVYAVVCVLAGELFQLRRIWRRGLPAILHPTEAQFPLAAMTLFSLAYIVLLVIRSADFDVFDRYLLPILPWGAMLVLVWFNTENRDLDRILRKAMPISWAILAVLGMYAIASTQDLWALAEARVRATRRLESAGVPRTAIDGGFEINAWTQLTTKGRINSRWVSNPPGAYDASRSQTPVVVPVYRLEYAPDPPETSPSEFGFVPYFSLLPPFRKQVSIDRVLTP